MKRIRNYQRRRKERRGYHARRTVYSNDPAMNARVDYPTNYVKTTKYNIITFLPKNIWEQLHRTANVFFVVLMALSMTPLSPIPAAPQIMAVACIMGFQAVKDAHDDLKRYRSDRSINSRPATVLRKENGGRKTIQLQDIRVGDIVRVENNEEVPADLLLLSSAQENGQCFLETANLDGESNLKLRTAHPLTSAVRSDEELLQIRLQIEADEPCVKLYEFDGSIKIDEEDFGAAVVQGEMERPLTIDSFLHRGTTLRNTEFVYGLVLYTGHQTKFMLNVAKPRYKASKLESILNKCILAIIGVLVVLCVGSAVIDVEVYEYNITKKHWYIMINDETGQVHDTILSVLTFVVVYGNLVPLSLYVNLEITRMIQAYLLENDLYMFDRQKGRPMVRASNLMEELGQIDYIFADKTGTLTRNEMRLRACSVGGVQLGCIPDIAHDDFDEEADVRELMGLSREERDWTRKIDAVVEEVRKEDDPLLKFDFTKLAKLVKKKDSVVPVHGERQEGLFAGVDPALVTVSGVRSDIGDSRGKGKWEKGGGDIGSNDYQSLLLCMAMCNSVVPAVVHGSLVYQSSSPDESALVEGAKEANYVLVKRSVEECTVEVHGQQYTFETLAMNEFTSERRRMSVIVRMPCGKLRLFVKGADETVFPISSHEGKGLKYAQQYANKFAEGGLRTLVFAQRDISEEEYRRWIDEYYNDAQIASVGRREKLSEAAAMIERGLRVIGSTGIEDRMQDLVPHTIESLMKANIKVWVLTGDKGRTAVNIAQSCRLISPHNEVVRIPGENEEDKRMLQQRLLDGINVAQQGPTSLVIDGNALAHALEMGMSEEFTTLGSLCASVVCCRSTPIQKKQVVDAMKDRFPIRTLAIGDGANDVAMIQAAHVGVGVMGNEGMQAVMSSDFVIGQFRFLIRLLILHGRWSYQRTGLSVCYVVYKNVFLTLIPFWFGFYSMWSGEVYLDPWMRTLWNFTFTGFPCVVYSFLEQDLPAKMILNNPELYRAGQTNAWFNSLMFFQWFMYALWDGIVCFFGAIYTNYGRGGATNANGWTGDYYSVATVTYTVMCVVSNLHLFLHTRHWNKITHYTYWISTLSWFVVAPGYSTVACIAMGVPEMYGVTFHLYGDALYWLSLPVLTWACMLPDIIIVYCARVFNPTPVHILQEVADKEDDMRSNYDFESQHDFDLQRSTMNRNSKDQELARERKNREYYELCEGEDMKSLH